MCKRRKTERYWWLGLGTHRRFYVQLKFYIGFHNRNFTSVFDDRISFCAKGLRGQKRIAILLQFLTIDGGGRLRTFEGRPLLDHLAFERRPVCVVVAESESLSSAASVGEVRPPNMELGISWENIGHAPVLPVPHTMAAGQHPRTWPPVPPVFSNH